MLVQQFFKHPDYARYLTNHFVLYHADSGEESGRAVFEKYDVNTTPCVLVGLPDGSEVDRIVGYEVPPEQFRETLDRVRRGENTMRNLLQAYEQEPGNLEIAANLARKSQERFLFSKMQSFSRIVLENAEAAEKIMLPFGKDGREVTAYEYARYTSAYTGPEEILDFLAEFPESPLRSAAFDNLAWYLSHRKEKDPVLAVYGALLKKYPDEPDLLIPLITHCAQSSDSPDQGLLYAASLERRHPERFDASLRKCYGALLLKSGDKGKALDVYGPSFIEPLLAGSDYRPLNDYAWFWATWGENLESALAAAQKALALRDAANVWDTASMVYRKQGCIREAISAEERAVKLSDGAVPAYIDRLEELRQVQKKQ